MTFTEVTYKDIDRIKELQPEGWPDIASDFKFYINSGYCYPIKVEIQDKIAGVGAAIKFEKTGWLAHIIVGENFRKKGIGYSIVVNLINILKNNNIESCLLIATELGRPVYLKAGFKEVTEYTFLKKDKTWLTKSISAKILPFNENYTSEILNIDSEISGENREILVKKFMKESLIYYENGKVLGYYMPTLKEGLIYAKNFEAGTELMNLKYSQADKAVLPSDNKEAINFLKENGFIESGTKGTRMIYGKPVNWKPQNIYSRIGGNFG